MAATPTMRAKGDELEARVATALRRWGGRADVGVHVTDTNGNRSELDVVAFRRGWLWGWQRTLVVECKHYAADHTIPLEAVAKFKEVLTVNRVPLGRGVFVTTSSFTPRALHCGVATVDGKQLPAWLRNQVRANARHWALRALLRSALLAVGALAALGAALDSSATGPPLGDAAAIRAAVGAFPLPRTGHVQGWGAVWDTGVQHSGEAAVAASTAVWGALKTAAATLRNTALR
jgi:hypothetical protein